MIQRYRDRQHAGEIVADGLQAYSNQQDVIVLGLPRGGVPVAAVVAQELNAPLDIFLVRKLGTPYREEMAMGAIASGGARVLNHDIIRVLNIQQQTINDVATRERHELERREHAYRGNRPMPELADKTVILVDDGMATGATMKAAVQGLKQHNPDKIVVALPTGSREACQEVAQMVDDLLCILTPEQFGAVGRWYDSFGQTSDEEVRHLLQEANKHPMPNSVG